MMYQSLNFSNPLEISTLEPGHKHPVFVAFCNNLFNIIGLCVLAVVSKKVFGSWWNEDSVKVSRTITKLDGTTETRVIEVKDRDQNGKCNGSVSKAFLDSMVHILGDNNSDGEVEVVNSENNTEPFVVPITGNNVADEE